MAARLLILLFESKQPSLTTAVHRRIFRDSQQWIEHFLQGPRGFSIIYVSFFSPRAARFFRVVTHATRKVRVILRRYRLQCTSIIKSHRPGFFKSSLELQWVQSKQRLCCILCISLYGKGTRLLGRSLMTSFWSFVDSFPIFLLDETSRPSAKNHNSFPFLDFLSSSEYAFSLFPHRLWRLWSNQCLIY